MGSATLWRADDHATLDLPILAVIYLFFAVRFSPDLLANGPLWKATFALFVAVSALYILLSGAGKNFSFTKWYIPFFLYSAASLFWTDFRDNTIEGLNFYIVAFASFFTLSLLIKNAEDLYLVIKVVMLAFFTCFIDMLTHVNYSALFGTRLGMDNINENWNANTFGAVLATFIFLSIFLYKRKKLKYPISIFAVDFIFLFFVFLTGSRSALIMLALSIALLMLLERKGVLWNRLLIAIAVFIVGYLLIMNVPALYDVIGYRFDGIATGASTEGSYIGRSKMIQLGIVWFKQSPILGYGVRAFTALSPWNTYAHSNYIELLVDLGLIGTGLYYVWALIIALNRKMIAKSSFKNYILSVMFTHMVLDFFRVSYNSLMSMFLVFTALILIDLEKNKNENGSENDNETLNDRRNLRGPHE